jgi:hypothetical protein
MSITKTRSPLSDLPSESFAQYHRMKKVSKLLIEVYIDGKTVTDVLALTAAEKDFYERRASVKPASDVTWGTVAIMLDDVRRGGTL